ncbi:MAG TPA: ATP-binding protein [Herbaspirillum sp.]|uniref:ATP-binding protein n=1 Tax=Herbaspirillum sp. TaxID=1890675 RepID=UPI002D4854B8|nr:ATP-binding protein [Herbaspirillum sp.]HZG20753.1 ATP-binding protein [Herbaspirillum sp.]
MRAPRKATRPLPSGGHLNIKNTIQRDLVILWAFIALIALVLAFLLLQLSRQGASSQISQATGQAAVSCAAMSAGLAHALSGSAGGTPRQPGADGLPARSLMQAVIDLSLRDQAGVEGGFWHPQHEVVAYAFPTYDGSGIKRDPPGAEMERIVATAQRALDGATGVTDVRPGLREAVVFAACPVALGGVPLVGWTLKRVPVMSAGVLNQLLVAIALLLAFVIASGAWLGSTLSRWRSQSERLSRQLSHAERLATLGRVAAGMAHEIRNPIGAMRMKAENALAAPAQVRAARVTGALEMVVSQTERLDALVASLLALAQPFQVQRQRIDLGAWIEERRQAHAELAERKQLRLDTALNLPSFAGGLSTTALDPVQMARALDNLLLNALAHCEPGGLIQIGARLVQDARLLLWVADDGPGVAPELRESLFDPFVSQRSGGTGLGLVLVREIVHAHGGSITLATTARGARFDMELPWRAS